ncbi:3794_t:CDS:2 [Funneliformis mosseae]|uniref:3794_t:CDS:1 n=1 Tax=Funneliformis mosseae TaxID=27381 RepID=A0A9N9CY17_FUNMO|nr:3794_t:CDS:2 [Funneliformis mosseae]
MHDKEYSLDVEAESIISDHRPLPEWPVKEKSDLVISELPPIFKGVTFNIITSVKVSVIGKIST